MKKELTKKILIGIFSVITVSALLGTVVLIIPQKNQRNANLIVEKGMAQVNKILSLSGKNAQLISWENESGGYKINFKVDDKEYSLFMSKDGKYLFPTEINLMGQETATSEQKNENQERAKTPEKRERPDVKLFVMSHCPFGLQVEKAILPVWKLLKNKADFGIYFVDYIMHGKKEMEENLRQYCLEQMNGEGYLKYLECFLDKGDYQGCLEKMKIDRTTLERCIKENDEKFEISKNFTESGYPPFNVHKDLNQKYGVQGSPTLVINDTVVEPEQRSPEKVKEAICNAFSNPPSECQEKLSEKAFSPGFGLEENANVSNQGQCK